MDLAELKLFAHVVSRPETELDLARAALLVAEPEYPGLDVGGYVEKLDALAVTARERIAAAPHRPPLATVIRFLFEEMAFRGNDRDYYDPRNSFLNEVLDRRLGIPITLALVITEICRRVGIVARGVGFPGHFLVRIDEDDGVMFLDPFDGRLLDDHLLEELHARATGQPGGLDPRVLAPARKVDVLLRILRNLGAIYEQRRDRARLLAVLARMQVLQADAEVAARIAELGSAGVAPGKSPAN
jgi:regulator of sirC expression with transglutaminase-like and TPR domain